MTHLDFCWSIIESLAMECLKQQQSHRMSIGRPLSQPRPVRLDRKLHLLELGESRRDCVVCSDRSTGSRHTIPVTINQHFILPSFEHFHTL